MRQGIKAALTSTLAAAGLLLAGGAPAAAQPLVEEIAPPLPVVVPGPSDWQPKFPYPYDASRHQVTDADITAQREMCQWFTAQYDPLITQIERFNTNLIRNNGDYNVANNNAIADAVAANIDQSVHFLAPRTLSLTLTRDYLGDEYFPLYQGESFYRLWQHLSNLSAGIRGRQPAWFVGPSLQRAMRWGGRIDHSRVCD
ncbi:hypothetical protein ACQI4L_03170 [Mycolicibacterium litorale]|uniref:hypothetical protein n=1 Tax=Mycolicibacterium litorale TaxID=758802 RepID=UPI003CF2E1DC